MIDTVRIILFLDCNLRCSYCCNQIPEYRSRFQERSIDKIDFDKYRNVVITGGEPFLHKDRLYSTLAAVPVGKTIVEQEKVVAASDMNASSFSCLLDVRASHRGAPRVLRILDLFCRAGGASMGLHRAFPEAEIVGVDILRQPRYPFTFVQADALTYPLDGFDFVWASPPCKANTRLAVIHKKGYIDVIPQVRERLTKWGGVLCH